MKERKAPKNKHELDPESEAWKAIAWRKLEKYVFRIQKRIYRASQQGKTRTVQKLQKLLMKSEAARLLAVRRVTQDNQGKKTAGVDGVKSVNLPNDWSWRNLFTRTNGNDIKPDRSGGSGYQSQGRTPFVL